MTKTIKCNNEREFLRAVGNIRENDLVCKSKDGEFVAEIPAMGEVPRLLKLGDKAGIEFLTSFEKTDNENGISEKEIKETRAWCSDIAAGTSLFLWLDRYSFQVAEPFKRLIRNAILKLMPENNTSGKDTGIWEGINEFKEKPEFTPELVYALSNVFWYKPEMELEEGLEICRKAQEDGKIGRFWIKVDDGEINYDPTDERTIVKFFKTYRAKAMEKDFEEIVGHIDNFELEYISGSERKFYIESIADEIIVQKDAFTKSDVTVLKRISEKHGKPVRMTAYKGYQEFVVDKDKISFKVHPKYKEEELEEKRIKYYDLVECFEEIDTF